MKTDSHPPNEKTTTSSSSSSLLKSSSSSHHVVETIKDIIASIIGSAANVYTGQPFDTIKVRLQVASADYKHSAFRCFQRTIAHEGVSALWKGSIPALLGAMSENTVAFGINGILKRLFDDPHSSSSSSTTSSSATSSTTTSTSSTTTSSPTNVVKRKNEGEEVKVWRPLCYGAVTGFFSSLVICPFDIIKSRSQVFMGSSHLKPSTTQIVRDLIQRFGYRGFYLGYSAQLMRDVPFYASFFGCYEIFVQIFRKYTDWDENTICFLSGGFAGQVGWVVSIGPDTLKSTMQTANHRISLRDAFWTIHRQYGYRGFFSGIEVAVVRAFPANAALFLGYELSRKIMN